MRQQRIFSVLFVICLSLPACEKTDHSSEEGRKMTLNVNGDIVSEDPDERTIRDSLSGLNVERDGEGFAILGPNEMRYLQISGDPQMGFDAEYQEGDIESHFRAQNESFTLNEVVSMMTEYRRGNVNWEKYGTWSKIKW
jgi:hypothetical protein